MASYYHGQRLDGNNIRNMIQDHKYKASRVHGYNYDFGGSPVDYIDKDPIKPKHYPALTDPQTRKSLQQCHDMRIWPSGWNRNDRHSDFNKHYFCRTWNVNRCFPYLGDDTSAKEQKDARVCQSKVNKNLHDLATLRATIYQSGYGDRYDTCFEDVTLISGTDSDIVPAMGKCLKQRNKD